MAFWSPQPGPQADAAICPADKIFFGGTRGGGKSDCALGRQLRGAEKYAVQWNGLVLRRKYKDFAEMRRRLDEMIAQGLPCERIGGDNQPNYVRFTNGAQLSFIAIKELAMLDSLQGQQFTEISIDEATTFPFLIQMIDKLNACLRSPHGVPCHMFFTGNPGGPGHNAAKVLFIEPSPSGVPFFNKEGESTVFIRSTLDDNRILCDNDPDYVRRLRSIKDPALRKAWLEGDWNVFIGQAFNFSDVYHVIKPIWPIPEYAWLYMTFDWGFGKPFSVGWWWVDADSRIFRFAEWYGWTGVPDEGLRLTDSQIAKGILEAEKKFNLGDRHIIRLSDPTCFNKKPDYKGGGQGPSTAEEFAKHKVILSPGDANRILKIRQFRERLCIPDDEKQMPMLMVYDTCRQFIRTIPSLCQDEKNPEDIDTDQEDHCYDESCHICMARPIPLVEPKPRASVHDRRIERLIAGDKSNYEYEAIRDQEKTFRQLGVGDPAYGDLDEYEDSGELVETV